MFAAAEQDTLTLLRVNVVLARWIAERNLPLYAGGEAINEALTKGFSLGLTFPLHHVSYLFFSPDAARSGDFLVHIRALYDMNYTFRFDRDILNADVIVHGAETTYTDDGAPRTSYLVKLALHDELEWARYTDFEGLSGRKRGVAGVLPTGFLLHSQDPGRPGTPGRSPQDQGIRGPEHRRLRTARALPREALAFLTVYPFGMDTA